MSTFRLPLNIWYDIHSSFMTYSGPQRRRNQAVLLEDGQGVSFLCYKTLVYRQRTKWTSLYLDCCHLNLFYERYLSWYYWHVFKIPLCLLLSIENWPYMFQVFACDPAFLFGLVSSCCCIGKQMEKWWQQGEPVRTIDGKFLFNPATSVV